MHVIIFFLNTMFQGAPMCFLHEKWNVSSEKPMQSSN
jgi:hypothetical protein